MSSVDQQTAKSATVATFLTALVTNAIIFSAEIILFTILRPRFKVIYAPRTFIPVASKRVAAMSSSLFRWPLEVFRLDYDDIRRANGLDAYVFVRFLYMIAYILFPMWLISWAVLLPVDGVRSPVGATGLDRFTFGNIAKESWARYAAPLILAYLFTFWILYVVKREMQHFITVRQRYIIDPMHSTSAQAATMLITGVPPRYLHVSALKRLFAPMPGGGVKAVWINRDLKDIPDLFDERLAALNKLEGAETSLLSAAAKYERKRLKALKKGKEPKVIYDPSKGRVEEWNPDPKAPPPNPVDPESPPTLAERLVPMKKRPSHRLKAFSWLPFGIPFTGRKVDTIAWAKEEIPRLNALLLSKQELAMGEIALENSKTGSEESYPRLNSAFIQFHTQLGAQMALQSLAHHEPYRMANKYTDVAPQDVIWSNLNMNPYEAKVRMAISYAATAALIILWAIPVAFVGAVSNIHSLASTYSWLSWLNDIPSVVIGIISGLLPPVLLAVLFMLLPIVLRLLAKFEGIPTRTGVELSLMTRFFIFQVIHGFLIVSLASGIIKALGPLLADPSQIPSLLATNLPGASTFFLTYILLQASAVAAGFLQIVSLIVYYVKLFLLGSTPRSVYGIKNGMGSVQWGTLFPNISLLVVVTLAYSVISPIINGLAFALFFLLFMLYKYLFLYVYDQPASGDTGGLFFPKAITHVFVGLYVEQICLAALFFLAQKPDKSPSAIPEGALMIVLIVITLGYHIILLDSYGPLLRALPLSLIDRASQDGPSSDRPSIEESQPLREKNYNSSGDVEMGPTSTGTRNGKGPGGPESGKPGDDGRTTGEGNVARRGEGGDNKGNSDESAPSDDFTHPGLQNARVVWIPRDELGLGEDEERDIRERGIEVSTRGAVMNAKGTVDVDDYPPGEEPDEGTMGM